MTAIRPATRDDIPQFQGVQAAVHEKVLRTPGRVTVRDYEQYIGCASAGRRASR